MKPDNSKASVILTHRSHTLVELTTDVYKVYVSRRSDGNVRTSDEEEDGAVRVHVDEDGDIAAPQTDGLHVDVFLAHGHPCGSPGGRGAEGRLDLLTGHHDRVREDGHCDHHVQHDVAHGPVAEEELRGLEDVLGASRGAEEGRVALNGGHEVSVDRSDATPRAKAVVGVDCRALTSRVVDMFTQHTMRDLATHVDDADVPRVEPRGAGLC